MAEEDTLLTVREVARRCHRSEETVRRWIWSGRLPARKLGNQLFVQAGDLARIEPRPRVSEAAVAYRPRVIGGTSFGRRGSMDNAREEQRRFTKEELLRQIDEDEKLADEMLATYGPIDVVELLRQVREDD